MSGSLLFGTSFVQGVHILYATHLLVVTYWPVCQISFSSTLVLIVKCAKLLFWCDEILWQKNLGNRGFILAYNSRGRSLSRQGRQKQTEGMVTGTGSWLVTLQLFSGSREQWMHVLLSSLYFLVQDPSQGVVPQWVGPPASVNLTEIILTDIRGLSQVLQILSSWQLPLTIISPNTHILNSTQCARIESKGGTGYRTWKDR